MLDRSAPVDEAGQRRQTDTETTAAQAFRKKNDDGRFTESIKRSGSVRVWLPLGHEIKPRGHKMISNRELNLCCHEDDVIWCRFSSEWLNRRPHTEVAHECRFES